MGRIIAANVADLSASGGEFYIDAEADNSDMQFEAAIVINGLYWITYKEMQHERGTTTARYVFQATANDEGAARTGRVDFVYVDSESGVTQNIYPVVVTQPAPREISHYGLELTMTPEAFGPAGGSGTFTSTGTTYYTDGTSEQENALTSLQSSASWITINNVNRTFAVAANTGATRSAVISQTWSGVSAQVTITQTAGEVTYTYTDPIITLSYGATPAAGGTVAPTGRVTQTKSGSDGSKQYLNVALSELSDVVYSIEGTGATIDSTTGVITWAINTATDQRQALVSLSGTLNGHSGTTTASAIQEAADEIRYTYSTPLVTLSYPTTQGAGGTAQPSGRLIQTKTGTDGSSVPLNLPFSEAESMRYSIQGEGATIDANSGVITWSANQMGQKRTATVTLIAVVNGKEGRGTATAEQLIAEYYESPTFTVTYADMAANGGQGDAPTVAAVQVHHKADGTTETLTGVAVKGATFAAQDAVIDSNTGRITWTKNKSYDVRTAAVQFTGTCNDVQGTATAVATQLGQERIYMWPLWFDYVIEVATREVTSVGYRLEYVDAQHHYDVPPAYEGRTIAVAGGKARINVTEIIRHILPSGPAWMQEWLYTDDLGNSQKFYVCSDYTYSPADPFVGALMYDLPAFYMTDQLQRAIYRNARFYIGAWGDASVKQYDKAGNIIMEAAYSDTFLNSVTIDPDACRMDVICGDATQRYCCVDAPADRPAYVLNFGNRYGAAQSLCVWGNVIKSDGGISIQTYEDGTRLWDTKGAIPRRERIISVGYTPRWSLNTGFLYNVPEQLQDIFVTPEAELYDMHTGTITPVVVEATAAEYKTYRNQGNKPVNFTITVRQAAKQTTYR